MLILNRVLLITDYWLLITDYWLDLKYKNVLIWGRYLWSRCVFRIIFNMHIYAGQIPVIAEEAKDPSHILGYAAIRGFEHQYMQWFYLEKLYLTSTNIHAHTRTHFGCKHHYKYFHTTMHCIKGRGSGNRNNNKGGYCNIHVLCLWNILIIRVLSQLL